MRQPSFGVKITLPTTALPLVHCYTWIDGLAMVGWCSRRVSIISSLLLNLALLSSPVGRNMKYHEGTEPPYQAVRTCWVDRSPACSICIIKQIFKVIDPRITWTTDENRGLRYALVTSHFLMSLTTYLTLGSLPSFRLFTTSFIQGERSELWVVERIPVLCCL